MDFPVLTIFLIIHCYGVNSEKVVKEAKSGPPKMEPGSSPLLTAGYMIQQVTRSISNVGQIYYFQRKVELLFPNRGMNGSIYTWHVNNGSTERYYFEELKNEVFATVIPVSNNVQQFIFGSDRSLRLCTKNDTDYTLSEPLIDFKDNGFSIHSAHCDRNGIMFILLVMNTGPFGKLYKIKNRNAEVAKSFFNVPRDFRFNNEFTAMYMVNEYGKKITKYEYNLNTAELGNATDVFSKDDYPKLKYHILKSVVPDRDNEHLWVAAAGKEGLVLRINPFEKTLISITPIPNKDLTFATFGYDKYKTLFVGSRRKCTTGKVEGSIFALSGMGVEGVADRPIKW